jgi:flagellar biosynthetic protein FlhB
MADQPAQERTEPASPRRLEKAHTEGQVPRSQELLVAVVLLAAAVAVAFLAAGTGRHMLGMMREASGWLAAGPLTENGAAMMLTEVTQGSLLAMAPLFGAVMLSTLFVGVIQARGVLALKPITPDFSRIDPVKGLGRLLGPEGWFTLLKAIVKLVLLGAITWGALTAMWPTISGLVGAEAGTVLEVTRTATLRIVSLAGITFLALSLADYGFVSWRHHGKLKMTRQELTMEHRESEGDPLLKGRMRSLAQQLTRQRMLQKVKEADAIIVNPTNIAVAIKYDGRMSGAPMVLAMGQRKLAERIRAIAAEAGVPIVRNIPVARALIATAKVGRPIPPALYAAIAEILAFVYRQRGHLPAGLGNGGRQ